MFTIIVTEKGQSERRQNFEQTEVLIGRVAGNDLILPKGNVSKRHARLTAREGRFVVIDEDSANGTYVNRRRITQATLVREGDRVYIGDYTLRVRTEQNELGERKQSSAPDTDKVASAEQISFVKHQEQTFEETDPISPRLPYEVPGEASSDAEPIAAPVYATLPASPDNGDAGSNRSSSSTATALKALVEGVSAKLGPSALDSEVTETLRQRVQRLAREQLASLGGAQTTTTDAGLIAAALDELLGVGALTAPLRDDTVTRITINGVASAVVFHGERCVTIEPAFSSPASLERSLVRLCRQSGVPLQDGERFVERNLPNGFRLFALRSDGHVPELVSLTRSRSIETSLQDLVQRSVISEEIATFLGNCVVADVNILVVGPTSSGASEVSCALVLAADDSWIAIEDRGELLRHDPRIGRLDAAKLASNARETLGFAARVTGARLLVENFSGPIAAATLDALAQGAEGVVARTRAPSVHRALMRIPADIAASGVGYDLAAAREALSGAFQIVIEVTRLHDGSDRVLRVCELQRAADGALTAVDIFGFVALRTGASEGSFVASGKEPDVVHELRARGIPVHDRLFRRTSPR